MKVLGMISGTSHDGIDVAVVDFSSHESALTGTLLHSQSTPYDDSLRQRLIDALPPAQTTFAEMCELDTLIGQEFAAAAQQTIAAVGEVDFICSHGQTVFHWVNNDSALGTLQIGKPAWIAAATNTPVVSDVRIRDITLGGHGAPLVSILDQMLLNSLPGKPAALNMGGISNMTVLGAETPPLAYDVGPANALIDAVISQRGLHPAGYDHDGEIASAGTVNSELLNALLSEPYYDLPAPKSTGKELFHGQYLADALSRLESPIDDVDLVATLTELTVQTVARDVKKHGVTHLVVSGGGSHNPVIMDGLRAQLPGVDVVLSEDFGAPVDDKEAIAFALIGWLTAHGLPGTIPSATGASAASVLGTITPGAGPLALPTPGIESPTEVKFVDSRD